MQGCLPMQFNVCFDKLQACLGKVGNARISLSHPPSPKEARSVADLPIPLQKDRET